MYWPILPGYPTSSYWDKQSKLCCRTLVHSALLVTKPSLLDESAPPTHSLVEGVYYTASFNPASFNPPVNQFSKRIRSVSITENVVGRQLGCALGADEPRNNDGEAIARKDTARIRIGPTAESDAAVGDTFLLLLPPTPPPFPSVLIRGRDYGTTSHHLDLFQRGETPL